MKPTPHPFLALTDSTSYPIACFFALLFFFGLCKAAIWLFGLSAEIMACFHESEDDAAFEDCARLAEEPEPPQSPAMHAASHPDALAARDHFIRSHGFDPLPKDTLPTAAGGITSRLQ